MVLAAICRRCCLVETWRHWDGRMSPLVPAAGGKPHGTCCCMCTMFVGRPIMGKEIGYGKQQAGAKHSGFFPQYRP